ncbi:MAG: PKD domain-containing protein, partial [Myxococcales bacterium]|nr:PKD domain-containing protein [Myxococcales bacterium]
MLASSLFAQAPRAVAQADPLRAAIQQEVTFDHSQSFHLNPNQNIVRFEWDFDGDGVFDFQTANPAIRPTFRYNPGLNEVPRVYTARLRVTDDQNPPLQNTGEIQVTVDSGNVPPVARITPANPDAFVNQNLALSGAQSFDPNAGAPLNDRIVSYEWDLDDTNGLNQFQNLGPNVNARFGDPCGRERQVALRVTDNFGETHVAFARVNVLCNQPPVIVLDPNPARVDEGDQLVIDASGTSDPEGNAFQLEWACDEGLPIQIQGDRLRVDATELDAPEAGLRFNCSLTATDALGAESVQQFVVVVNNVDSDDDGVDEGSDNCPATSNPDQADNDGDGIGDACDEDDDNDGVLDPDDNCDLVPNPDQANADGDRLGNACDPDDDNDGVPDDGDNCPLVANADQANHDADPLGDACDDDDDNDGAAAADDNCPVL